MKNLILGLMLIAAPAVFSQDDAPKASDKFAPKVQGHIVPSSLIKKDDRPQASDSRDARKIQYSGVVQMRDGIAIVVLDGVADHNRVCVVNLPEDSQVTGRRIQFNMSPSRAPMPQGVKCGRVVIVSDVSSLN
jgi:hypothetical protein